MQLKFDIPITTIWKGGEKNEACEQGTSAKRPVEKGTPKAANDLSNGGEEEC